MQTLQFSLKYFCVLFSSLVLIVSLPGSGSSTTLMGAEFVSPQQDDDATAQEQALELNRTGSFKITRKMMPAEIYARASSSFGGKPVGQAGDMIEGPAEIVYQVRVSDNYDPEKPAGVFAFINSGDNGKPPKGYPKVLAERNMIYVGADKSGNEVSSPWRVGMAAYAIAVLGEAYNLDYDRIYISGSSGGGRAASHGMMGFQDVFSGGLLMVGANPMLPMQNFDSNGNAYSDPGVKSFKKSDFKIAGTTGRYVFYSAAKDYNKKSTMMIAQGYQKHGFKFVTYLEDPSRGHGPASAEYLGKALDYLDAPIGAFAIARMKSAGKLIRSKPAIAARYFRSVMMHADATEDADDLKKAEEGLAKIKEYYTADLEKTQAKLQKGSAKSKAKILGKFANKWLTIGASDVATMREELEQAEE